MNYEGKVPDLTFFDNKISKNEYHDYKQKFNV
jgi:hypothetical protein